MPLTVLGSGYRVFSEPVIFACNSQSQIELIEIPVDNAFAFVADSTGSSDFELWRFNAASTDVASATVIIPDNPQFVDEGRWYRIPTGINSGAGFLAGNGDPEGVVTGEVKGQSYLNLNDNSRWVFAGTPGTNTGWV